MLTAFLYAGCVSSSPVPSSLPSPAPVPEGKPALPEETTHNPVFWRITPTSQTKSYSSLLTTLVTATDSSTRRDSITARTFYSISTTRTADSLFFSGSITQFVLNGTAIESPQFQPVFPILYTGKLSKHIIQVQGPEDQSSDLCNNSHEMPLRAIQRNVFLVPLELSNQETWTDSTSTIVCSGSLPVTLTSLRTFHIIGESEFEGFRVLVVEQNEKTFSKGEGSEGQHRIFVNGNGSTTGRLYIDSNSGQLLSSNLKNQTSLAIQSSGRIQHFLQNSTEVTQIVR